MSEEHAPQLEKTYVSPGRKREEYLPMKSIATAVPIIVSTRANKCAFEVAGKDDYSISKYSYIEYRLSTR
jgi:hypothetical protein